jgi:hypothetical protein
MCNAHTSPPHPASPPVDQPPDPFFLLSMNEQRPFVSNRSTIAEPCFSQVRRVEPFSLIYVKVYPSLTKRKTGLQALLRLWRRPFPHGSSNPFAWSSGFRGDSRLLGGSPSGVGCLSRDREENEDYRQRLVGGESNGR